MQFINDHWHNILDGIIAGIALIPIIQAALLLYRIAKVRLEGPDRFSLTGFWVGPCRLPHYPPDVEAIEIYRLVERGERVKIIFFNYLPTRPDVLKYRGKGIRRGGQISAYYYLPAAYSYESGVFVVRLDGGRLRGVYAQFDPITRGEPLEIGDLETFALQRIHIPFWKRVKMFFGKKPYKSYKEVNALCNDLKVDVLKKRGTTPPELPHGSAEHPDNRIPSATPPDNRSQPTPR